jgi:hypothetical protein
MAGGGDEPRNDVRSRYKPSDHYRPDLVDFSDPVIEAYKKYVDGTILRENLKLTAEERFIKFERFWEYAQERMRRAWLSLSSTLAA